MWLHKMKVEIGKDLDELQAMINRKKGQYLEIETSLLLLNANCDKEAEIIDCINGPWDEE